jgi:hypothetical protein
MRVRADRAMTARDHWEQARAGHAETAGHIVVMKAEGAVRDTRSAGLAAEAAAAWRRHRAARGQVTRALRNGDAEKIRLAQERERAAYVKADETGRRCIEEMQQITGAGLTDLGTLINQIGRNIEADRAALEAYRQEQEPDVGQ